MKPVAQLTIEMAANVARLQKDMEAAKRTVGSAMSQIERSAGMAMKALGALGVGLSAAAFAGWIKGAIDAIDKTEELSQKVGVAVKDLAGLQLAFRMGGVEAGALQIALQKLSTGLTEGNAGLKAMGISSKNADGSLRSTREVLALVADEFASYQDGAQKTALAIEVFGKAGADLLPMLNGGSKSLAEFDEMARKLGITLDQETAEKAAQFNDTLDLMKVGFEGLAQNLAIQVLPFLQDLADRFFDTMREGDRMSTIGKVLGGVLKGLGAAAIAAADGFKILGLYIGGYAGAFSELMSGNFSNAYEIIAKTGQDVLATLKKSVTDISSLFQSSTSNTIKVFGKFESEGRKLPPVFGAAAESAKKAADEYAKMIQKADELVESLQFETRALEMDNQERETSIQLRKLEAIGIKQGTEEYERYAQAIMDTVAVNESIKQRIEMEKQMQKDRIKQEEEFAKQMEQINNQIGQSLTDALMNGGMNAKEFLINMFKTMVLRPILQPIITGMVGAVTAGAAGTALAGGEGGASASSLMSMGSALNSAYSMVTSGFTSIGTYVTSAATEIGMSMSMAAEAGSMMSTAGNSLVSSAATLGTVASYLGGAAAGIGVGEFISGGKSVIGGTSLTTTIGGTIVGAIVGGPLGAAIGGAIGGLINAAFGSGAKEYTDTGISGTLKAMGADLQEYSRWKKSGGWFSSTKRGTEFRNINANVQEAFNTALGNIGTAVAFFAGSLGQPVDAISSYSKQIKISFKDLSEQEIAQAIENEIKGFETGLVQAVFPTISQFAYAGEEVGATLKRLSESITVFNKTLDLLGFNMFETSLEAANMASNVINMFGGQENFIAATSAYYDKFYSAQEKINYQTEQLTKVFGSLNLTLPTTHQQFRALVDTAQMAGDYQTFSTLVQLAPAFDALQTAIAQLPKPVQEVSNAIEEVTEAIGLSAEELKRVADERYALETRLLQLQGNTAALRERELAGLFESNRALQKQIWTLEDAAAAQEKAAQAAAEQTKAAEEALQKLQQIANERFGLESKMLQLQGNTVELRNRELAALDPTNRALQQMIYNLEDAKTAMQEFVSKTLDQISKQISASSNAADKARESAQAYREASTSLKQAANSIFAITQPGANIRGAFASLLSSARGGNIESMKALPEAAQALQDLEREQASSSLEFTIRSAQIANQLTQVAAVGDVLSVGADYQAQLLDINTSILELTRESLQSGNATVDSIKAQTTALEKVGQALLDSQKLMTKTYVDESGAIRVGLADGNGKIIGELSENTTLNLQALANQTTDFGTSISGQTLSFGNSITGQTTQYKNLSADQIKKLSDIATVTQLTTKLMEQVSNFTSGNKDLTDSVLSILSTSTKVAGFDQLLTGNNTLINSIVNGNNSIITALNTVSTQLKEIGKLGGFNPVAPTPTPTPLPTPTPVPLTARQQEIIGEFKLVLRRDPTAAELSSYDKSGLDRYAIRTQLRDSDMYRTRMIKEWYNNFLYRDPTSERLSYWMKRQPKGAKGTADIYREMLALFKENKFYADGGFYPGGMAMVGEEGPELINFKRPGQVYTASETRDIMGNSSADSSNELRQLREENRAQSRAMVALQARMTRIIERWEGDGLPAERYEGVTA